jgi:AcrR family transcriptional regulator
MTRRAAAVEATRRRIVEATVSAHRDLGVQATSWEEIARRAGVGVGTVYRHFPSLDELLPACGEVVASTLALPARDRVPELFKGTHSSRERIERLVKALFGAYERGAPFIRNIRRERRELPYFERRHRYLEGAFDALTREALRPLKPSERQVNGVRALTDLSTWSAFRERGFSHQETTDTAVAVIECWLRSSRRSGRAQSS